MQRMESEHVRRLLKLYFIMGSVNCFRTPLETLVEAIDGGITLFQYREKGSTAFTGQAYIELAQVLQQKCRERKIPFIVNDDIDLAVALDADCVQMWQTDAPVRSIRERPGAHKLIGLSAHNAQEAQQAIADAAASPGVAPPT
ncbi:thiamine-phosphate pyrophosphorylase, partial [Paenibacillus riograndensis]